MGFPITKMRSSANQTPHCRFSTVRRNTSRSDQTEKYFCLTIWNRPRFKNSTCFPWRTRTCVHTCAPLKPSPTAGNSKWPQVLLTGQHPRGEIGSLYAAKRKKRKEEVSQPQREAASPVPRILTRALKSRRLEWTGTITRTISGRPDRGVRFLIRNSN